MQDLSRIGPKPFQIYQIRALGRFGMFSVLFRAQVGSKTLPGFGGTAPFGAVWPKIELQGTIFDFRFLF